MLDERTRSDAAGTPPGTHDFCGTGTQDRLSAWLQVLGLQVELFSAVERAALQALPCWAEAHRILDVGCGDGSYLATLADRWPGKSYTGLEASPEFVAAARTRNPTVDVVCADYFDYASAERFDVVLMRFVVQHLDDWPAVLAQARRLLTPRGSLLIVEPDVTAFANTPPLPRFTDMLISYGREAASRGRLRATLDELGPLAEGFGWHPAEARRLEVVSTGASAVARGQSLYLGWMELCRQCGYVAADYTAVAHELDAWSRAADARSVIGLILTELRPA